MYYINLRLLQELPCYILSKKKKNYLVTSKYVVAIAKPYFMLKYIVAIGKTLFHIKWNCCNRG